MLLNSMPESYYESKRHEIRVRIPEGEKMVQAEVNVPLSHFAGTKMERYNLVGQGRSRHTKRHTDVNTIQQNAQMRLAVRQQRVAEFERSVQGRVDRYNKEQARLAEATAVRQGERLHAIRNTLAQQKQMGSNLQESQRKATRPLCPAQTQFQNAVDGYSCARACLAAFMTSFAADEIQSQLKSYHGKHKNQQRPGDASGTGVISKSSKASQPTPADPAPKAVPVTATPKPKSALKKKPREAKTARARTPASSRKPKPKSPRKLPSSAAKSAVEVQADAQEASAASVDVGQTAVKVEGGTARGSARPLRRARTARRPVRRRMKTSGLPALCDCPTPIDAYIANPKLPHLNNCIYYNNTRLFKRALRSLISNHSSMTFRRTMS
jgi:hypothetical protein